MNNYDRQKCERWMARCEPATYYHAWRERTVRSAAAHPCWPKATVHTRQCYPGWLREPDRCFNPYRRSPCS